MDEDERTLKNYYVWLGDTEDASHAWLTPYRMPVFDGVEFRLDEGEPCAGWFPKDFVVPSAEFRKQRDSAQ